jgi:hypothetical protein
VNAALGLKARTGRAVLVVLAGSADAPHLRDDAEVEIERVRRRAAHGQLAAVHPELDRLDAAARDHRLDGLHATDDLVGRRDDAQPRLQAEHHALADGHRVVALPEVRHEDERGLGGSGGSGLRGHGMKGGEQRQEQHEAAGQVHGEILDYRFMTEEHALPAGAR